MKYNDAEKILSIVKKTIAPVKSRIIDVDLSEIERIISTDIPEALKHNAPMNFPELYFSFKEEYERFKLFLVLGPLIGKRIVALGGGFSSGKSSFINSLLGKITVNDKGRERLVRFLPAQTDPTTSVPTYIVNGQTDEAYGINIFDNRIKYELSDIEPLSHGFGSTENDKEAIKLGQILKTLFVATPLQVYRNIAFLDTPGYSKPDTENYSQKTDENIAMEQLSSADCIMWFIRADKGTLHESDIKFLKKLHRENIPLIFVITAADSMADENSLKSVIDEITSMAVKHDISFEGVFAVSNKLSVKESFDKAKLVEHIKTWDKPVTEQNFAYNFSILFIKCKEYLEEKLVTEKQRLEKLNISSLKAENRDVSNIINELITQSKSKICSLNSILEKLAQLRTAFFTELRRISSVIGIELPEADEVSLAYESTKCSEGPVEHAEKLCIKNDAKYLEIEKYLLSYLDSEKECADSEFEIGNSAHEDRIFDILCKYLE